MRTHSTFPFFLFGALSPDIASRLFVESYIEDSPAPFGDTQATPLLIAIPVPYPFDPLNVESSFHSMKASGCICEYPRVGNRARLAIRMRLKDMDPGTTSREKFDATL